MTRISRQPEEVDFDLDDVLEFISYANKEELVLIRKELGAESPKLNFDFADRLNITDIILNHWSKDEMVEKIIEYIKQMK